MKTVRKRLTAALICSIIMTSMHSEDTSLVDNLLNLTVPVRVLLKRKALTKTNWKVKTDNGFILYNPEAAIYKNLSQKELTIAFKKNTLYIADLKTPKGVTYILPQSGLLTFNDIPYEGFFALTQNQKTAYLVNHIGLEDYLSAVIPYEAIPSWPDEVLKAQCIAARTYALSMILTHRAEYPDRPFDVYCTEQDQVYNGKKSPYCLRRIVDETSGMILTRNNRPIKAMYSAVCGGVIPAQLTSHHLTQYPYLKRNYACNHCKEQRNYRWNAKYSFDEVKGKIKKRIPEIGTLEEIKVTENDDAGVAQTIAIKASDKWYSMEASTFRMLLPKLRSLCCTLDPKEKTLHASGKGFGHHIGLCQWGAYYMDKKGFSYTDILSFYYPNTTLKNMSDVSLSVS